MKNINIIFFLFISCFSAHAQKEANSGIIYGRNHAFSVTAPKSWVLDNMAGVSQGIYAVFYKLGESWEKGETVMYVNTAPLEGEPNSTLDELIQFDLDDFQKNYKDLVIEDATDIIIDSNVRAKVKYLSGKSYGNFEAIAYIDAGKTGVMIILTSRTKKGFNIALKPFEDLVKSYFFMANEVILEDSGEEE